MHTAYEGWTLALLYPLGDHHGYIPVPSRRHLHALKIERMLLARLQVVEVECTDNFFAADQVPGVGRSRWLRRSGVLRLSSHCGCRKGCRSANRGKRCDHEITAIKVTLSVRTHGVFLKFCCLSAATGSLKALNRLTEAQGLPPQTLTTALCSR